MKLTRTTKRANGMTLLELTVVILVLLSLISILFVGARAWKKGSDRSANILNVRNIQQAARGHQNMHQLNIGDELLPAALFGNDGYLKEPKTPKGAAYTYGDRKVPAIGNLYVANPDADGAEYWYTEEEVTAKLSDW